VNSDIVLCGSFGLCPSHVDGVLNFVKKIRVYVFGSEMLNYADYVEKCIADKESTFKFPTN